jgi:hypothetical protein
MVKLSLMMLDRRSSLPGHVGQPPTAGGFAQHAHGRRVAGPIPTSIGAREVSVGFGGTNAGSNVPPCCFFVFFSPVWMLKLPTTKCSYKHGG